MDESSNIPQTVAPLSIEEITAQLPADMSTPQMPPVDATSVAAPVADISILEQMSRDARDVGQSLLQPAAGGPSILPAASEPVAAPVLSKQPSPQAAPAQLSEPVKQAITPTSIEVQQSLETQAAPVRRMIADSTAKNLANAELSKFIQSEQKQQEAIDNQIKVLEAKDNDRIKFTSFGDIVRNGDFGQKFMSVLAVGLGAVAKATGSAKNPALEVIDRAVEQQSEKDKLSFEQKLVLKKQLIESSQNMIQAAQNRFGNEVTQQKLQLEYDKLEADRLEAENKLKASYSDKAALDILTTSQLQGDVEPQGSAEEIAAIKANNEAVNRAFRIYSQQDPKKAQDLLEKKITLPNGQIVVSPANVSQVNKFNETRSDIDGAKQMINKIISAAQSGNKLDPRDRAEIQSNIIALTGRLRLAYLGPGAMTQQEYDRLYQAIGDPSKIFSLDAIELAKLNAVKDNLDVDLAEKAKSTAGLKWPVSKRVQMVNKFRAQGASAREASERTERLLKKMNGG